MNFEQTYIVNPDTGEKKRFPQDFFDEKKDDTNEEKGWTVVFIPWEDDEGKPRVAGRFKTAIEKDKFLEYIAKPGSGWMEEEISSINCYNDYNYMLPY